MYKLEYKIFKVSPPQIIVENGVKSDVPALSDVELNNLDPLGQFNIIYDCK